ALPLIDRMHPGNDVHAGGQTLVHKGPGQGNGALPVRHRHVKLERVGHRLRILRGTLKGFQTSRDGLRWAKPTYARREPRLDVTAALSEKRPPCSSFRNTAAPRSATSIASRTSHGAAWRPSRRGT